MPPLLEDVEEDELEEPEELDEEELVEPEELDELDELDEVVLEEPDKLDEEAPEEPDELEEGKLTGSEEFDEPLELPPQPASVTPQTTSSEAQKRRATRSFFMGISLEVRD